MGENGSGKSTLVKMLSGVHRPDHGSITVAGSTRSSFSSPADALHHGIATLFQEVLAAPNRPVLDTLLLGTDGVSCSRCSLAHRWRRPAHIPAAHHFTPPHSPNRR